MFDVQVIYGVDQMGNIISISEHDDNSSWNAASNECAINKNTIPEPIAKIYCQSTLLKMSFKESAGSKLILTRIVCMISVANSVVCLYLSISVGYVRITKS